MLTFCLGSDSVVAIAKYQSIEKIQQNVLIFSFFMVKEKHTQTQKEATQKLCVLEHKTKNTNHSRKDMEGLSVISKMFLWNSWNLKILLSSLEKK